MSEKKFDINKLRIASPCPISWEVMKGDDRARFCDSCQLNVFNVSEMTESEVRGLVSKFGKDRLCIKLYKRTDGTVLTRDCPVGLRTIRQRAFSLAGASLAAIISLFSISQAQSKKEKRAKGLYRRKSSELRQIRKKVF